MTTDETTEVARLTDELAIRDLVARAGITCSTRDADRFRALWTDDGIWTIGQPFERTASGPDDIAAMLLGLLEGNDYFF